MTFPQELPYRFLANRGSVERNPSRSRLLPAWSDKVVCKCAAIDTIGDAAY